MYAKNVVPFKEKLWSLKTSIWTCQDTQQFVRLLKPKLLHYGALKILESFHKLFKNWAQNYFKEFQLYTVGTRLQMDEKSLLPESIENLILCFTCYVKCHKMFANCLKLVSFRRLSLKSRQEKP